MKKTARVGSYLVEKEPAHLKVSHENGTFNFRLKGGVEIDQFFEEIKKDESKKYFEVGFASANVFTILMMQNPEYLMAWVQWHNDYFEKKKSPEVTDEKDAEICKEEEALYELEHQEETVATPAKEYPIDLLNATAEEIEAVENELKKEE